MTTPADLLQVSVHNLLFGFPSEGRSSDPMLEQVVAAIDSIPLGSGGAMQFTVVCGVPITGELIPAWRWFQLYGGEFLNRGLAEKTGATILSGYSAVSTRMAGAATAADYSPRFLHLRNARTPAGGGYGQNGALIRIRLRDVSAWHLGEPAP